MNLYLLFDVRPDPVSPLSLGAIIVFLLVILILSVSLVGGLVFLLIRMKRRKEIERGALAETPPV